MIFLRVIQNQMLSLADRLISSHLQVHTKCLNLGLVRGLVVAKLQVYSWSFTGSSMQRLSRFRKKKHAGQVGWSAKYGSSILQNAIDLY